MLTSKTPLRVSFFGGGTDYPEYFEHHAGAVLGTSIDKFIYISALRLESLVGHAFQLSYSKREEVNQIDDIQHPVFRECLRYYNIEDGWNFAVQSSLPSHSGLGSSSAFTVGLIQLLTHLKGLALTRYDLAQMATYVERVLLKENVGIQDQLHSTFGNLNLYRLQKETFSITPVRLHSAVRDIINTSMYLIYTGTSRFASETVADQIRLTKEGKLDKPLAHLYQLTQEAVVLLENEDPDYVLRELGDMLHDAWMTKRSLSKMVSTSEIDELYDVIRNHGSVGGKLCGGGAGGFLLALIPQHAVTRVQKALGDRRLIPIHIDEIGSTITSN